MSGTDALITLAMLVAALGFAGVGCWLGERHLQKKQQDWRGEGNSQGVR